METKRALLCAGLLFATWGMASGCAMGSDSTSPTTGAGGGGAGGAGGVGGSGGSGGTAGLGGAGGAIDSGPCEASAAVLAEHAISEPSPIVSTDRPIVSSDGVTGAEYLVDGDYTASRAAVIGELDAGPEWVAIDVGEGPSRLLFLLTDAGFDAYDDLSGGAPVGYSIDVSADSNDGEDGEWETVVAVSDNSVRNRAHTFDFDGMRWVRFTTTEPAEGPVELLELELHDLSNAPSGRAEDSWLFFGDSIHQAAMTQARAPMSSFGRLVTEAHPAFEPIVLNASIGGEHLSDAIDRLDELIDLNPDIEHFAIAYGTNDSWGNQDPEAIGFRDELVEVVETILDAGHTPVIAHIPYASVAHETLPAFNAIIDEVASDYGLPCGPDLYGYFLEHPEHLGSDGVHPNTQGNAAINQLWADAMSPLYAED